MADVKVSQLPEVSEVDFADDIMLVDTSDPSAGPAGTSKRAKLGRHLGPLHGRADVRLALAPGGPYPTGQTASATILYMSPCEGNAIGLYDGVRWQMCKVIEQSMSLFITAETNYDVFAYAAPTTVGFQLGPAWATDNARAAGLVWKDGVLVLATDATRRYVGTVRGSTTNATCDTYQKRYIYSHYHRVHRPLAVFRAAPHTYTTSAWRTWGGDPTLVSMRFVTPLGGTGQAWYRIVLTGSTGSAGVSTQLNGSPGPGGYKGEQLGGVGDWNGQDTFDLLAGLNWIAPCQYGYSPSLTYDRISYSMSWWG